MHGEAFALPVPSGDGAPLCASVRSLDVSFGGRRVLHGIDADFPALRITVLLGRSGSGKTTFLRALNRLNECFEGCESSGDVRVSLGGILRPTAGPNASFVSRLRRAAGMVFQTPNPLPMSIRRNVTLPVLLAGDLSRDRLEEILMERLQEVGLWEEVAYYSSIYNEFIISFSMKMRKKFLEKSEKSSFYSLIDIPLQYL